MHRNEFVSQTILAPKRYYFFSKHHVSMMVQKWRNSTGVSKIDIIPVHQHWSLRFVLHYPTDVTGRCLVAVEHQVICCNKTVPLKYRQIPWWDHDTNFDPSHCVATKVVRLMTYHDDPMNTMLKFSTSAQITIITHRKEGWKKPCILNIRSLDIIKIWIVNQLNQRATAREWVSD